MSPGLDSGTNQVRDEVTDAVLAAARVLVGVATKSIAAAEESIGVNQFRALVIIASRGPLHSAALAEAMDLHASNATRTCDRLVAAKLLDRRDNPADRRHLLLSLTKKGHRLVDGVMNRRRTLIADILTKMPAGDQHQLAAVLNQFAQAGGEPAEKDLWAVGWTTAADGEQPGAP